VKIFIIDIKESGNYRASISFNKQMISLGTFKTEEQAAIAYNKAAIIYHGEFALLNDI
jgi:hypothetical protein